MNIKSTLSLILIGITAFSGSILVLGKGDSLSEFERLQSKRISTSVYDDSVKYIGKDVSITEADIESAKIVYLANGETDEQATQNAVRILQEFNALYVKAVDSGFYASDEEVDAYLKELRAQMENAVNSDEVKRIIHSYGNEEDYWNHMKDVYIKRLPVQNYVSYLEAEFAKHCELDLLSDAYREAWGKEFEIIKEALITEQEFHKVN